MKRNNRWTFQVSHICLIIRRFSLSKEPNNLDPFWNGEKHLTAELILQIQILLVKNLPVVSESRPLRPNNEVCFTHVLTSYLSLSLDKEPGPEVIKIFHAQLG